MEMFGFGSFVFLIQAKHMIMLRDSVIQDVIQFLEHCEGKWKLLLLWPTLILFLWLCAFCRSRLTFLYICVFLVYGKNVAAVVEQPLEEEKMHPGKNTVTFEARELKSLFMRLVWSVAKDNRQIVNSDYTEIV